MHIKKRYVLGIVIFFLIVGLVLGAFSRASYADDFDDTGEKPNIAVRMVTGFLKHVSGFFYGLLDDGGISIDVLVFNEGENESGMGGLSLFKKGDAQDFLASFYNLFNYMALVIFVSIANTIGFKFANAGDNAQSKALLKDKSMKMMLTMALLFTMPQLLTILVTISHALVDIVKGLGSIVFDDLSVTTMIGSKMEYVKSEANFADGVTAAMLVGINIWIIVVYILRDLIICFLFLFFPVIAIWHPVSNDKIKGWWSNILGNVLVQPIHAVILTTVLSLGNAMFGAENTSFASSIYTIVTFGATIPMSGMIMQWLGLETGVGAASSRAGLGGLMAMGMLARGVTKNVRNSGSQIKSGLQTLAGNRIADLRDDKNLGSIGSGASVIDDLQRPLINPQSSNSFSNYGNNSNSDDAKNRSRSNRRAGRQIASGIGGLVGGSMTALASASIGGGLGVRGAAYMGSAGYNLGSMGGKGISTAGAIAADSLYQNEKMQNEIRNHQIDAVMEHEFNESGEPLSRDEALMFIDANPEDAKRYSEIGMNRYFELDHSALNGTEFQKQEREALLKQKTWENRGIGSVATFMANKSYANMTPTRKSSEELASINNALLYQDKDITLSYVPNELGGVGEVLSMGKGNVNIKEPTLNPISFGTPNSTVPADEALHINTEAHIQANAFMKQAYPLLDQKDDDYKMIYQDRMNHYKREMTISYQKELDDLRKTVDMPSMNIDTNEQRFNIMARIEQQRRVDAAREVAIAKTGYDEKNIVESRNADQSNVNLGLT